MEWLSWVLLVLGFMAVFVVWDLAFCGGERCRALIDRLPDRFRLGDAPSRANDRQARPPTRSDTTPK